jgi:hypothetical protein
VGGCSALVRLLSLAKCTCPCEFEELSTAAHAHRLEAERVRLGRVRLGRVRLGRVLLSRVRLWRRPSR